MFRAKVPIQCALVLFASSGISFANTLDFEDIAATGPTGSQQYEYSYAQIQNGYNGLQWNNFYVTDGLDLSPAYNGGPFNPAVVNGGYYAGVISGKNVAFNGGGTPAFISGGVFNLISAYLTAVWNNNATVEVIGISNGKVVDDNTYTLSATTPTLLTFDYYAVTEVEFISSGGTAYAPYNNPYGGSGFAMDNLNINVLAVPDAGSSAALFGVALTGLAFFRRKLA